MLLGGDDDERATVELAGGLAAIDELPQPRERGLRVAVLAVVVAQAAAAAVLARLGDVGAQLVDHEADASGGDTRDPLARLRVGRALVVGSQQRVDELCRRLGYVDPGIRARGGREVGRATVGAAPVVFVAKAGLRRPAVRCSAVRRQPTAGAGHSGRANRPNPACGACTLTSPFPRRRTLSRNWPTAFSLGSP